MRGFAAEAFAVMIRRFQLLSLAIVLGFSPVRAVAGDGAPLATLDPDPFAAETLLDHPSPDASDPFLHYLRGVVAASKLDATGAARELAAVYNNADAEPQLARRALSIAGAAALRSGDYAGAADLFGRELMRFGEAMEPHERAGEQQNHDVAAALRDEPAQTTDGGDHRGRIALGLSAPNLTTVPLVIEGHLQDAVVDTGANLSVLSATAAKMLGVRVMDAETSVRSATLRAVASRIAVADTVRVGPLTLHQVVFIVLDDVALSPLGPGHRIDAIIGFPVLAAMGRVAFREEAAAGQAPRRSLTISPSRSAPSLDNLRFAGFDAYVRADDGFESLPFFIDSGADKSNFEKRYAREFAERLKGLELRTIKVGGAGGSEERQVAIVPNLTLGIGASHVTLSNVQIHLSGSGSDTAYGTIGADALWAKGGYTVDFTALELSLGAE